STAVHRVPSSFAAARRNSVLHCVEGSNNRCANPVLAGRGWRFVTLRLSNWQVGLPAIEAGISGPMKKIFFNFSFFRGLCYLCNPIR
ncbi:MAG: hypothetical protein K2H25_01040, partial [Alistipes sp.]|nr:hypothetical protein [Alistipes sp.]